MIKSTLILGSLLSASAMACPQLAGEYFNCTSGDPTTDDILDVPSSLVITQKVVAGKMTYKYVTVNQYGEEETEITTADGPARKWSEDVGEFPGVIHFTAKATCNENVLKSSVKGELEMDDTFSEEERRAFEEMLGGFLNLKSDTFIEGSEYVERIAFEATPGETFEFRCSKK